MKKIALLVMSALLVLLSGCGSKTMADGVYEGKYEAEDSKATTEVTITIKDNKIVDCTMISRDDQGMIKDENYGKDSSEENYKLAQLALKGMQEYPAKLVETQNVEEIDAVTGATITLREFNVAVEQALEQAKK